MIGQWFKKVLLFMGTSVRFSTIERCLNKTHLLFVSEVVALSGLAFGAGTTGRQKPTGGTKWQSFQ